MLIRPIRSAIVLLVAPGLWAAAACSDSTGPVNEPPPPPPAAELVATGAAEWAPCTGSFGCHFRAEVRNQGPDCAVPQNGWVRFYDQAGTQVGTARRAYPFPTSRVSPAGTLVYTTETFLLPETIPPAMMDVIRSFAVEPKWTAVRC